MIQSQISDILAQAHTLKPKDLIISDLKWKYLLWAVYRQKNILFVGHTRCGKTKAILSAAKVLDRPIFIFNLGSTQDARATLIGNIGFKRESGTYFASSEFVQAIQTPNAIVLLDELTRANHDAWNILMPVLDPTLRFLRQGLQGQVRPLTGEKRYRSSHLVTSLSRLEDTSGVRCTPFLQSVSSHGKNAYDPRFIASAPF